MTKTDRLRGQPLLVSYVDDASFCSVTQTVMPLTDGPPQEINRTMRVLRVKPDPDQDSLVHQLSRLLAKEK